MKKGVLRNLTKFTGKHLCQSLFFNKVAGLSSKNTYFTEHFLATASVTCLCEISVKWFLLNFFLFKMFQCAHLKLLNMFVSVVMVICSQLWSLKKIIYFISKLSPDVRIDFLVIGKQWIRLKHDKHYCQ